ncbi:MAG: class I adenylate-forming enzyme family protein [Acidimicrobiales bacterium]
MARSLPADQRTCTGGSAEAITYADTYAEMVLSTVKARPDHPALVFPGRSLTYSQLWERSASCGSQLRALGVEPGETFGVMLPNSPQFVELLLGAARLGAVPVPINTRHKAFEVAHVSKDGDLRALFTTSATPEQLTLGRVVTDALPGLDAADPREPLDLTGFPHLRSVVMLGPSAQPGMMSEQALDELPSGALDAEPGARVPSAQAPFMVLYTSGTTSRAKGCVFTNDAFVANADGTAARLEMTSADRCWSPLPMFHVGALLFMSAVFSRGGTFISQEHFDAKEALALCAEQRPTVLYPLFPTITLALLQHSDFSAYDSRDVRAICNVGRESTGARVQRAFPNAVLVNAYGMTEVCGTLSYTRLDDRYESRMCSCGPVLPGWEAFVVDPGTGKPTPPRVKGELVARGRSLFSGYYNHPEETAASKDADGFFHTGDHCSIDEDGLISFHGRLRDVLKVGGETVSAHEVETYLESHPGIELSQVVGVPDDRLAEVPVAFVELAPGSVMSEEDVIAYCRGAIASFKVPRRVRFVTEWPMSSTKIQKFRLREQIMDELGLDG